MSQNPTARVNDLVIQDTANETLIYDLTANKAFCLNETSALVYRLCDGKRSTANIANEMSGHLNTPVDESLVWLAIDGLRRDNLIKGGESGFNGQTRREVIKRIGFASMVALPVVSSLVAPHAAMAQSISCVSLVNQCRRSSERIICDVTDCIGRTLDIDVFGSSNDGTCSGGLAIFSTTCTVGGSIAFGGDYRVTSVV
jgi:hypothetical protein